MGKCSDCKNYEEEILAGRKLQKCVSKKALGEVWERQFICVNMFHTDCKFFEAKEKGKQ